MNTTSRGPKTSSYVVPGAWPTDEEAPPNTVATYEPSPYDENTHRRLSYTIVGYKAILLANTKVPLARASIEGMKEQYAQCPPHRLGDFVRPAQMKLKETMGTLTRILQLLAMVYQRCEDSDILRRVNMLLAQVHAMQPHIRKLHHQLSHDEGLLRDVGVY